MCGLQVLDKKRSSDITAEALRGSGKRSMNDMTKGQLMTLLDDVGTHLDMAIDITQSQREGMPALSQRLSGCTVVGAHSPTGSVLRTPAEHLAASSVVSAGGARDSLPSPKDLSAMLAQNSADVVSGMLSLSP